MRAGKLRHRLEIQLATETRDIYGGTGYGFSTLATVWGSIEPLDGRELSEAQRVKSDVTHLIKIRYYAGLTASHRFCFDSTRYFNIKAITKTNEINREMVCQCVEVTT